MATNGEEQSFYLDKYGQPWQRLFGFPFPYLISHNHQDSWVPERYMLQGNAHIPNGMKQL
jgi:hypothetical protein